jgi:hypothetical protein
LFTVAPQLSLQAIDSKNAITCLEGRSGQNPEVPYFHQLQTKELARAY